jgi:transposase
MWKKVEVVCALDEDKRTCGICQADLRYLGKEHVRDELEIIPAQVRVLRYIRFNYVCTVCEKETGDANIAKAPVPAPVMKRSLASPSTVAYVMYQKYANGMPLYRPSHEWLEPMYNTIQKHLITEPLIHADESAPRLSAYDIFSHSRLKQSKILS